MIRALPRIPLYGLVILWILAMISVPIVDWTLGNAALSTAVSIGVLLQVIAVCRIVVVAWGLRRMLLTFGVILALAWLTEYIGHTTGFPFGRYAYTPLLQPQLGGVPLLIPLAWLMMLPPAWAVAHIITRKDSLTPQPPLQTNLTPQPPLQMERGRQAQPVDVKFVIVSALAFTAWDLFLDPQMVAWDLWRWAEPSGYFGIPFSNYAGWLLASSVLTVIASRFAPIRQLPTRPLVIIYAITWVLEMVGLAVFWGLPAPALVGFAAMGLMLLWAWRRGRE